MTSARRSVVAAVAVSTACALPIFLTGALAVQVRADLGFSKSALGLGAAVFFGVGALTSAGAGRFVERVGPARGMRLAAAAATASMLGIATVAHSWPGVLAFLAVGGAANALAQPGSNLLLAHHVRSGRQGLAFGMKQSAIPASMLLGGLAVPAIALTVGWRWAFVAGAAAAACTVSLVPGVDRTAEDHRGGVIRSGQHLPLVVLAVAAGLGAASANTLGSFLVESTVAQGVGEASAGWLFALGSAIGLLTRLGAGLVADRRRAGDAFAAVAAMLAGGAVGFVLLASGTTALLVPGVVLAFGLGWGWPGLFNLSVVTRHRGAPGAATGLTQTGVYLGAVVGPLGFGVLADQLSFAVAWSAALAGSLVAAIAILFATAVLAQSERRRGAIDA